MIIRKRSHLLAALMPLLALSYDAAAQVKIGDNPTTVNSTAVLEMESTNKGLLLPRLTNTQMTGIQNPATALMVWCTDCTPAGLRIYDGTKWTAFYTVSAPVSVVTSISCGGALSGTYLSTVPMNASHTKAIGYVGSVGAYVATTNTVNGVQFSAAGSKLNAGSENVVLAASGTPLADGTFTYTVNLNGATCTFDVTFASAVYNCGSVVTSLPTANLVASTAYSGTISVPYSAGNNQPYGVAALTSQGLTLTRVAGTYTTGGGTVLYNLSGTYTGTTTNPSFTIDPCGTYFVGGARYSAPPSVPYTNYFPVGQPLTNSSIMYIDAYISSPGITSFSTNVVNGVSFSLSEYVGYPGNASLYLEGTGTPLATGNFTYTLTDNRGQTATFNVYFY